MMKYVSFNPRQHSVQGRANQYSDSYVLTPKPMHSIKRWVTVWRVTDTYFGDGNGVTGDPCKVAVRGFDSPHLHHL
jgi:hypothetical protein